MLSARDVQERSRSAWSGGLPPGWRPALGQGPAAEFGTSPSTVGRAVQELARQGWVTATSRRGAVVRAELPATARGVGEAEAAIRRLAVRWRLVGGGPAGFQALVARVAQEVFPPAPRTVFLECNPVDLKRGLDQVQRRAGVPVEALLLEQAARVGVLAEVHVLLTPYFHLAEARALAPAGAQVVPLTFVASQEAVGALVELPAGALVGVLAVGVRSRGLEGLVQQWSSAAVVGDLEAAAGLVEAADLVLATNAARLPGPLAARARRLLRVGWSLEPGSLDGWPSAPTPPASTEGNTRTPRWPSGAACGARPCRAATAR